MIYACICVFFFFFNGLSYIITRSKKKKKKQMRRNRVCIHVSALVYKSSAETRAISERVN